MPMRKSTVRVMKRENIHPYCSRELRPDTRSRWLRNRHSDALSGGCIFLN
jgi:hypothetical protein